MILWVYPIYILAVTCASFFAIKAASYSNILYHSGKFSGAFIGVVILAIITSLPEVFTSFSSVTLFDMPAFPVGNVLGSNLFNITIISLCIIIYQKKFRKRDLSKIYPRVVVVCILMYLICILIFTKFINLKIQHFNVLSPILIIIYMINIYYVATADDVISDEAAVKYGATVDIKHSSHRTFAYLLISAMMISITSAVVTYTAGIVATRLGFHQDFAGAILLGIATSIPEISAFVTLFQLKNYDVAVGGMIGSNVFNFTIITVTDFAYKGDIFIPNQIKTTAMLLLGLIATGIFMLMLAFRNKYKQLNLICPAFIVIMYVGFLFI